MPSYLYRKIVSQVIFIAVNVYIVKHNLVDSSGTKQEYVNICIVIA